MEHFEEIIKEFEAVVSKLDAWYMYYKGEGLFESPFGADKSIEGELAKQIESLKSDIILLKAAQIIINLNNVAKTMKNS